MTTTNHFYDRICTETQNVDHGHNVAGTIIIIYTAIVACLRAEYEDYARFPMCRLLVHAYNTDGVYTYILYCRTMSELVLKTVAEKFNKKQHKQQ